MEGDLDRADDQAVTEGLDHRRGKEIFDFMLISLAQGDNKRVSYEQDDNAQPSCYI